MAFLKFNRKAAEEKSNSFSLIAEGDYELFVKEGKWEPKVDKPNETPLFNLELVIRSDVEQEHKGRKLFHSFYISRDPEKEEQSMDFINRFNLALGIPDGVEFDTQEQWLSFIIGKPVKANVYHKPYNGKEYANIKYFMETEYPEMEEQQQQSSSSGLKPAERESTYTKIEDDPFSGGGTIDIDDDDLPF